MVDTEQTRHLPTWCWAGKRTVHSQSQIRVVIQPASAWLENKRRDALHKCPSLGWLLPSHGRMDGKTGERQHESNKIVDDHGISLYF